MNPRIAVYLRVSTDQQSHDAQEAELKEYCIRKKWIPQWYRDTASGTKQDRQALSVLMAQVRRGRVDVLLTYKLDRLARSLSHLAQILAELQAHGVALICPSQGIDTSVANPAAQLQLNILAAVAQFERELIVERVRAGVRAAQAKGVRLGRPAKNARYLPKVRAFVAHGMTAAAISRELSIPYSSASEMVRAVKAEQAAATTSDEAGSTPAEGS